MGGANTICSDKTGTLTQNRMTVVEGWLGGAEFVNQQVNQANYSRAALGSIIECVSVNSTADIEEDEHGSFKYVGNKTECSLLVFVTRLQGNYRRVRKENKIVGL
jgi:magnesium-transporting ATPase (P-type)